MHKNFASYQSTFSEGKIQLFSRNSYFTTMDQQVSRKVLSQDTIFDLVMKLEDSAAFGKLLKI